VSARARSLAEAFASANDELIALLLRASPDQWRQRTPDEGELRAVGVIAHHVAEAHVRIARRVAAFARGEPVPARHPELFDKRNAREAQEQPEPDQRATIERLKETGAAVSELIASLSDQELDRTASEDAGAPLMTTAQVIEQRQIGHVLSHLSTIRSGLRADNWPARQDHTWPRAWCGICSPARWRCRLPLRRRLRQPAQLTLWRRELQGISSAMHARAAARVLRGPHERGAPLRI
jgi:hypothetical protein